MQTRKSISVAPEVLARFDQAVKIAGANRSKLVSDMMEEFVVLCDKTQKGLICVVMAGVWHVLPRESRWNLFQHPCPPPLPASVT